MTKSGKKENSSFLRNFASLRKSWTHGIGIYSAMVRMKAEITHTDR